MRILIVDDDAGFLGALEALLGTLPEIEVVGRAADGLAAVEAVEHLEPDVVVMDLAMPRLDGVGATKRIHALRPQTSVVILSGSDVIAHSPDAHAAGAIAYVRKANASADLPEVLMTLLRGGALPA